MINLFNRLKTFVVASLAISSTISAIQEPCSELAQENQETASECFCQPLFEIKAGYFFFSDSKMRKVYDKGGADLQLCASYPLWNLADGWILNAYGAIEYFHRSGKSVNDGQRTSLWSVPINIGIMPAYAIDDNTQYYFAIGPRYFYIHQHNDSTYVYKNRSRNGLGFFANTGVNYTLCEGLAIDIFGEYSYAKTHFHKGKSQAYTRHIQIGGFTFGGGIGFEF